MRLILASKSPRRRELLGTMGIRDFEVLVSPAKEPDYTEMKPRERVEHIALFKAKSVRDMVKDPEAVILGADTLVFTETGALGKPSDPEDAARMLRSLSGKSHRVVTGVALLKEETTLLGAEETEVFFAPLSDEEIRRYVESGEPLDKAGAYGIQGLGSVFIPGIRGDYFNVMGLPLRRVYEMLKTIGFQP